MCPQYTHPVGSMQPLLELTFLHEKPAALHVSLYVSIISPSVAAIEHAAILSYEEIDFFSPHLA